ncbi:hypothetical protein E4U25_006413 [Claviceps purpurea]|nr:hypothetical protein E4U25_006413 [Claviceps purpurea]
MILTDTRVTPSHRPRTAEFIRHSTPLIYLARSFACVPPAPHSSQTSCHWEIQPTLARLLLASIHSDRSLYIYCWFLAFHLAAMADKTPEPAADVAVATPVAAAVDAPAAAPAPAPAPASAPATEEKAEGAKAEGEGEGESKAAAEAEAEAVAKAEPEAEATTTVATKSNEVETSDAAATVAPADAVVEDKAEPKENTDAAEADVDTNNAADTTMVDADATTATFVETPAAKNKGGRRRSTGGGLARKASRARLTHTDAKPGDHFLVKLKGFPAWPAIICDEDMLPHALVTSRPVSAARPDGTYGEPFVDGGKRVNDRTFPVMYLHTNEFGWEKNTNLSELSAEKARDTINDKMRKDLKAAFELAIEQHPVQYYKDILQSFQDELLAQEEARREAAATPKKTKKSKSKAVEDDEDSEMLDVDASAKKTKKRKAEDGAATPQRPDSVKKPKIKLTLSSTPKTSNGAAAPTPKSAGAKVTKIKPKKAKETKEATEKKVEPAESKLSPEARHKRKVKEVLFLRHKLQKGLLTREQKPKEEEMQSMSDFITLLEKFGNLEVSIIRETKINKVLKAILKLDAVPREEEFQFKKRSQTLLDKWNKLLAGDASGAAASNGVGSNGNGNGDASNLPEPADGKKSESDAVPADSDSKSVEPSTESKAESGEAAPVAVAATDEVN